MSLFTGTGSSFYIKRQSFLATQYSFDPAIKTGTDPNISVTILAHLAKMADVDDELDEGLGNLTSHKGRKIHSYSVEFKLAVVKFAENSRIAVAARKYNVDRHSVREWVRQKVKLEDLKKATGGTKRARLD